MLDRLVDPVSFGSKKRFSSPVQPDQLALRAGHNDRLIQAVDRRIRLLLGDLEPRLHTPRLASPRPKVRAGSVAIGGEHTGIYTVDSPGVAFGARPRVIMAPDFSAASPAIVA